MNNNCSIRLPQPAVKPPAVGVYGIDQFTLQVPDLASAARFCTAIGLSPRRHAGMLAIRTAASPHTWARLIAAPSFALTRLTFAAYPNDFAGLRRQAEALGCATRTTGPSAFVLAGPDEVELEVVAQDRAAPLPSPPLITPVAPVRSQTPAPRPLRLSHLAIFTADVPAALAFYTAALGLVLSDRSGNDLAFLHAPHGSDHHVLALVASSGPGLHHHSWDMGAIDAIGVAALHAAEQGFTQGWGFGRHVLGSNYFHYLRDPWGSHAELTAGLEYIEAGQARAASDHPAEDAFYLWGPPPPAGFIDNHQAARHQSAA